MRTIELNGLLWDTENLKVGGKNCFTYEEAKTKNHNNYGDKSRN